MNRIIDYRKKSFCICLVIFFSSCSPFIKDEQLPLIKKYEGTNYRLKIDVKKGNYEIAKGSIVRLYLIAENDWLKVYSYSADKEFLKAERVLILYLFEDDFKDKKFNSEFFEKILYEVVQPVN